MNMLHEMSHCIDIRTTAAEVYFVCRDVETWASFMPAVKAAITIEKQSNRDVVEISAEVNGEIWTWRSTRELCEAEYRIIFYRLEPRDPILSMRGEWSIKGAGTAVVRLVLRHSFRLTSEDSLEFVQRAIESNATRDLRAIRTKLECR